MNACFIGLLSVGALAWIASCSAGGGGSGGSGGAAGALGGSPGSAGAAGGVAGSGGGAFTGGSSGGAVAGGNGGSAGASPGGAAGTGATGGESAATGTAGARGGAGGSGGAKGGAGVGGATVEFPAGYVPALIGVGYGGIRVVSRDGGTTWGDRAYAEAGGGDDLELLRAVVYGKGLWLATGWKLWTSADGIRWVDHGKLADGPLRDCNIVEGLAYKDGFFFAACNSSVYRSSDGLAWTKYSTIGDTQGHLFLTFRGGTFVAYGDSLTSFQSTDALTWTVMPGIQQATYCNGTFASQTACAGSSWFGGVFLRSDWPNVISRSTDGKQFTHAYTDDQNNSLYQSRAIAAGYVAPK